MIRWGFWLLISSGAAVACEPSGERMVSENEGASGVFLTADDIPLAEPFQIGIAVCNESFVIELRVDALMPAHRHGMNYTPKVTALGDNAFQVDGMLFHMPGTWEIQVDVVFGEETEFYTSTVVLK